MKANEYLVMSECVEKGINIGYARAFKHNDKPEEDYIKECILDAVTNQICEYFKFKDIDDE